MSWRAQMDDRGVIARYKNLETGEVISAKEYERRLQMQQGGYLMMPGTSSGQLHAISPGTPYATQALPSQQHTQLAAPAQPLPMGQGSVSTGGQMPAQAGVANMPNTANTAANPLIQPGAQMLNAQQAPVAHQTAAPAPTTQSSQSRNIRLEGTQKVTLTDKSGRKAHGFLDATSLAILFPTLVLLALIIAAAHKKRLFPWQTVRPFNPPSGLMTPREYERSFLCPPNLRRRGSMGKRDTKATWTEQDGVVLPFGFMARTHLPITIPMGRLPNKNMFIVAPSGSGKTTLMRAVIKALLAKPCVIIALEAKANDPNLDERKEGFKHTILPEAQQAGFNTLYFNPLDEGSVHWNPLDLDPIVFASSIVQDVNSLPPEEQHWAERDHGYISGLATLLKWGAVQVVSEGDDGQTAEVKTLPCNPRGLMKLVNNRRNIIESIRRLKENADIDPADLSELSQNLASIYRTETDWDKNIQGVRGRLRMFKNAQVCRVTEESNIDVKKAMHEPTVLIFGAPASLGPDAESLASCFVYQLQQALHTRYGTASVLPLFAFFDEYQTLNMDIAGRLSAIVRGANGGLTVILQNISQIAGRTSSIDPTASGGSELKTIFSNSAIRVCLHNADESTARFFSDEIGKHAVVMPGLSDHFDSGGFNPFPTAWKRIHSQQTVPRVDPDSIKRMERHHALVYLAPAGDAEHGELKPLMVDLRGIEDIAKLHLLHNVSSRKGPPSGLEKGPDGSGVAGQQADKSQLPMFARPASMSMAQEGAAVLQEGTPTESENTSIEKEEVLSVKAALLTPRSKSEQPEQEATQSQANKPLVNPPAQYKPLVSPQTAQAKQVEVDSPSTTMPQASPVASAEAQSNTSDRLGRICENCKQNAGKGRFCISCGSPVLPPQGPGGGPGAKPSSPSLAGSPVSKEASVQAATQSLIQQNSAALTDSKAETLPVANSVSDQVVQVAKQIEEQKMAKAPENPSAAPSVSPAYAVPISGAMSDKGVNLDNIAQKFGSYSQEEVKPAQPVPAPVKKALPDDRVQLFMAQMPSQAQMAAAASQLSSSQEPSTAMDGPASRVVSAYKAAAAKVEPSVPGENIKPVAIEQMVSNDQAFAKYSMAGNMQPTSTQSAPVSIPPKPSSGIQNILQQRTTVNVRHNPVTSLHLDDATKARLGMKNSSGNVEF